MTLLRWARCAEDGRLHLLAAAEAGVALGGGHAAGALRGIRLGAGGLPLSTGPAAALCLACLAGIDDALVSPARWAVSPYDCTAHLLSGGDQQRGRLAARCGAVLPSIAPVHHQPPGGRRCVQCDLHALADEHAPGRFSRGAPTRPRPAAG